MGKKKKKKKRGTKKKYLDSYFYIRFTLFLFLLDYKTSSTSVVEHTLRLT